MGYWNYVQPRMNALLPDRKIKYAGRIASASPATGSKHLNYKETAKLLDDAFA